VSVCVVCAYVCLCECECVCCVSVGVWCVLARL